MPVTTMLPELALRPDATLGDYAQVQRVAPVSELVSPTLRIRVPIAGFFAGAPNSTL